MKKNLQLERLTIQCDGIYLYRGKEKIALLKSIELDRGLAIKLGPVEFFVDIRELAKQEYPLKGFTKVITQFMTEGMAESLATVLAEDIGIPSKISDMLSEYWPQIQGALGVSDKQLENFFGIGSAREERQ